MSGSYQASPAQKQCVSVPSARNRALRRIRAFPLPGWKVCAQGTPHVTHKFEAGGGKRGPGLAVWGDGG